MNSYINLVIAIVEQARSDYKRSVNYLRKHPHSRSRREGDKRAECFRLINDCERFFLSQWFYELTGYSGKSTLEDVRKECKMPPSMHPLDMI